MAIKTQRDEELDLITHIVSGTITLEEMLEALEQMYIDGPPRHIMWDMSDADVSNATSDTMRAFTSRAVELGTDRQGKTAVVAPGDLAYGLARISGALTDLAEVSYTFRVFRTRQDALDWLVEEET